MKIESKFEVNQIVQRKYERGEEMTVVYEVLEVIANVCYGGTQIFYMVKPICMNKKYQSVFDKEKGFTWQIGQATTRDEDRLGWRKLREDELIIADEEVIKVLIKQFPTIKKHKRDESK